MRRVGDEKTDRAAPNVIGEDANYESAKEGDAMCNITPLKSSVNVVRQWFSHCCNLIEKHTPMGSMIAAVRACPRRCAISLVV